MKNQESLYGHDHADKRVSLGRQEKQVQRSAPTVSFVTSFEDELDIGDLFYGVSYKQFDQLKNTLCRGIVIAIIVN